MSNLSDDERGRIVILAARYGFRWAAYIGTFVVILAWLFAPDMIRTALWWYPVSFVILFLSKRRGLLTAANY